MAEIASGTPVSLFTEALALLEYPPPSGGDLIAVPHPSAQSTDSPLTTVVSIGDGRLLWVGSLDESMLECMDAPARPDARSILTSALLKGASVGKLIRPKALVSDSAPDSTVYRKPRPWVVLGEGESFGRLAAPLNDAGMGNPRAYQVFLESGWISVPNSKHANLELLHVWSFPASISPKGLIKPPGMSEVIAGVKRWYP